MSELQWLQQYYQNCCDGDWEHSFGVKIETLDNPGWYLEIDLTETPYEKSEFVDVTIENSETDWVHCRVKDRRYKAAGGPLNLEQLIRIFRQWLESG